MKQIMKKNIKRNNGSVLVLAMLFLIVFSSLSVGLASLSSKNLQMSHSHHQVNNALSAAMSGLECAKQLANTFNPVVSSSDTVTQTLADTTWNAFASHVNNYGLGGAVVGSATSFFDSLGSGEELIVPDIAFDDNGTVFGLRFYRYSSSPDVVWLESTGIDGDVTRSVRMQFSVSRNQKVLEYAIASRGRMIITGDTTINGDIFSTWYKPKWHAPFEITADSVINGVLNTVLTSAELDDGGNQMETLDAFGNPLYDMNGDKIISVDDAVQGQVEDIYYGLPDNDIPGLDEDDYDTSSYLSSCSEIAPASYTQTEYFPHLPGDYTEPEKSWNTKFYRHVYQDQTFNNAYLPKGRNALFENCTFEGVLYIEADSNASSTSKCNNVRFDDCQFNGTIVTAVPKNTFIQWLHNCLYFTGGATFNNTYSEDVTILAPNFKVNLGNTREIEEGGDSVITGAIVGGIVDVRGNALIEGTIISMYDTYAHSDGYVTNIGFADDGGDEGSVPGDVGTIVITPAESKMLPGGIVSEIVIVPLQETFEEVF